MKNKTRVFLALLFLVPLTLPEIETNLIIIRGTIDWNLKIIHGKGFKVESVASRWKKVTFENPFKEAPSILTSFNNKKNHHFMIATYSPIKLKKTALISLCAMVAAQILLMSQYHFLPLALHKKARL
jgi:hypothetical protein